jgi:dihydroorotate dehydrogenase
MYKWLIKPFLFRFQPEKAHHIVFDSLRFLFKIPGFPAIFKTLYSCSDPALKRTVFGLDFPNIVGLAAGLDKDATLFNELGSLGFGFVEIGTVTPLAQPGNEKPRLFRLPSDEALINRMGFNNSGAEVAAKRLSNRKNRKVIIGGNIGKNKVTPNEEAVNDYLKCFEMLYDHVDYFAVNVSSPNTPNLRELQDKAPLLQLLKRLQTVNLQKAKVKPILLKIAPDLNESQLDDIVTIVKESQIAGIIATNTTISREGLSLSESDIKNIGAGGLSGKPLRDRSTEVIRYLYNKSNGSIPIIGVGGIHSANDAMEKLDAGACLVQLYTGFIYEGPSLIKEINKAYLKRKKE